MGRVCEISAGTGITNIDNDRLSVIRLNKISKEEKNKSIELNDILLLCKWVNSYEHILRVNNYKNKCS